MEWKGPSLSHLVAYRAPGFDARWPPAQALCRQPQEVRSQQALSASVWVAGRAITQLIALRNVSQQTVPFRWRGDYKREGLPACCFTPCIFEK